MAVDIVSDDIVEENGVTIRKIVYSNGSIQRTIPMNVPTPKLALSGSMVLGRMTPAEILSFTQHTHAHVIALREHLHMGGMIPNTDPQFIAAFEQVFSASRTAELLAA